MGLGWKDEGSGAVDTVFTRDGDVVAESGDYTATLVVSSGPSTVQADLDALADASNIAYTGIAPSASTTVKAELDHRALNTGSYGVVSNWGNLLTLFGPLSAGVLTVNAGVKTTGSIFVPDDVSIDVVAPGFMTSDGSASIVVAGNVAGTLVKCESTLSALAFSNTHASGWDMEFESLGGSVIRVTDCVSLGSGVRITDIGAAGFAGMVFAPSAGTAGLIVSGSVGDILLTNNLFQAPGGGDYVGITLTASASVAGQIVASENSLSAQGADDALFDISPSATLPGGGAPPVFAAAVRIVTPIIQDPSGTGLAGKLFATGSLTEDDLPIVVSNGQNAPDTRLIGDAFIDVTGGTLIAMSFGAVAPGVDVVVPATNGVGGTLTLQALSSHFTLDVTDPNAWWIRYDGPDSGKSAAVRFAVDFVKSGAADTITGVVYLDTGAGFGPYEQSRSASKLAPTALPARLEEAVPVIMHSGDKAQIRANSNGNSAISINRIVIVETEVG